MKHQKENKPDNHPASFSMFPKHYEKFKQKKHEINHYHQKKEISDRANKSTGDVKLRG